MNIKHIISRGLMAIALGAALMVPAIPSVSAEEATPAVQTAGAPTQPAPATQPADAQQAPATQPNNAGGVNEDTEFTVVLTYKYTSERYGYSIMCPKKPEVIPASFFDESAKGDVLVFGGKDLDIEKAWIVLINAYDEADVPDNLGTLPEAEKAEAVAKFRDKFSFADASVVDLGNNKYGMYAITAKEYDVDTNGDGQFDDVAVASNQMIKTFLKGEYGGRFEITLMDNPALSQEGIAYYNAGLATFQQWPTSKYQDFLEASKLPKKKKK